MSASLREAAEAVATKLSSHGYLVYFVGGCVRDRLLHLPVKDIDIATSARPEEVMQVFPHAKAVGASFGVVLVAWEGYLFEVATFRKDGKYEDGRRPINVEFSEDKEDALRRDFTVNALFESPIDGRIVDYVHGLDDLKSGILRAIGNPYERFQEDSLRLMRAVRFAISKGLTLEAETYKAICDQAHLLARIAPERIQMELRVILLSENRRRGIELLVETGLMKFIIPEVYEMIGCEQPKQWHPEGDVFVHTMLMLDELGREGAQVNEILALATLLHDIGKPATRSIDDDGRIRFSGHDKAGADCARHILNRLKYSNNVISGVTHIIERHMQFMNVTKMRKSRLRKFAGSEYIWDEIELHRVDCLSSNGNLENVVFLREVLARYHDEPVLPPPFVTGRDLINLGLKPCPEFKQWLQQILDSQLEGDVKTRKEALVLLSEIAPVEKNTLADYLQKQAL